MDAQEKGEIFKKIFLYILGIFHAGLLTPAILSFAFFFLVAIAILQPDFSLPFSYSGEIDGQMIVGAYWKVAFLFSLIISFLEILIHKRFFISPQRKFRILGSLLFLGYISISILIIRQTVLTISETLTFIIPFFIFSTLSTYFYFQMSKFILLLQSRFN